MSTFHKSQFIKPPKWNGSFSPNTPPLPPPPPTFFLSPSCKFKTTRSACISPGSFSSNNSVPVMYLLGAAFAEIT